jgi:hypothetical protein
VLPLDARDDPVAGIGSHEPFKRGDLNNLVDLIRLNDDRSFTELHG